MEPRSTVWPFPFVPQDWEHTPTAVQAYVHTLQNELTQLRERVEAFRGAPNPEFHNLPPATVVGLALQEAAPTHGLSYAPESGRETGSSGPSPGACTSYDSPGATARAV